MKAVQWIGHKHSLKSLLVLGFAALSLSACSMGAPLLPGQGQQQSDFGGIQGQEAVPDEFIIKRKGAAYLTSPEEFAQQYGILFIREIEALGVELFKVSDPAILQQMGDVLESSEPNYLRKATPLQQASVQQLSALRRQNAVRAMNSGGAANNFIGIIGTGVDLNDKLLQGKLISGHNTLGQSDLQDDNGYGTQLAKIALSDSSQISGIEAGGKVIPIKAMDKNGIGNDFSIAEGIVKAVDYGARIIILGATAAQQTQALSQAQAYAAQHNVSIVDPSGSTQAQQALNAQRARTPNYTPAYPQAPQQLPQYAQYGAYGNPQQATYNNYNAAPQQPAPYYYPNQKRY